MREEFFYMTKINLRKTRWIKYFYEIQKEFELSAQQTYVYGYFYNHCKNLRDDGWCGYSDERLSKELDMSLRTFQRELETLKKKGLLIVQNPGKRTRRTGKSRMIYINTSVFLEEDQISLTDIELENAKKEIERLRKENEDLQAVTRERHYANGFTARIVASNVLPSELNEEIHRVLAPIYQSLANEYTYTEIRKHIDYMILQLRKRKDQIEKPVAYLLHAAEHFKPQEILMEEIEKAFNTTAVNGNFKGVTKNQEFYHQEVLDLDDDPFE